MRRVFRAMRWIVGGLAGLVAVWGLVIWVGATGSVQVASKNQPSHAARVARCTPREFMVGLSPGGIRRYRLIGELCRPSSSVGVLQVLVSGAGYASDYWDFPHGSGAYSYARRAHIEGHATFRFDRLGDFLQQHVESFQRALKGSGPDSITSPEDDGVSAGRRRRKIISHRDFH